MIFQTPKTRVFFFIVAVLLFGCKEMVTDKNNLQKDSYISAIGQKKDSIFRIFIDTNMKNDNFELEYTTSFCKRINDTFCYKLKGYKINKRIVFEFPKDSIPIGFIIDLGKDTKNVGKTIERIVINYNKNRIIVKDTALNVYFKFNKNLNFLGNSIKIEASQGLKNLSRTIETKENLNNRLYNRYMKE